MGVDNWLLVGRLKGAVKKVKILLSINRWRLLASVISASSSSRRQQRLFSFNDRPGLRAFVDYDTESEDSGSSMGLQRTISYAGPSPMGLHRTISYPSEDDIDKRAEMFIENFRRQLQIERQISLELKYCQGNNGLAAISS